MSLETDREQAKQGLLQIERSIISLLDRNSNGLRNAEIAEALDLRSDFNGRQKDYLTYSVLGGLIRRNLVQRDSKTKKFTNRESS